MRCFLLILLSGCGLIDDSETYSRDESCDMVIEPYCEHAASCFTSLPVEWCVDTLRPQCDKWLPDDVDAQAVHECLDAIMMAECPEGSADGSSQTIEMPTECEALR